jgi:hypothetical protein
VKPHINASGQKTRTREISAFLAQIIAVGIRHARSVLFQDPVTNEIGVNIRALFLSARKADLKKGFQHLVVLVLVVVVVVVGTGVKKRF